MRVAVTGAAGYLGMNLVDALLAANHTVTAIDQGAGPTPHEGVTWVDGNVLDGLGMRRALDGHDLVFHLAAKITLLESDPLAWHLNTVGVRTTAEAALAVGVRRFVHCSSVHSFDTSGGGTVSESTTRSTNISLPLYDRSKYAGELQLRSVIDAGLDAVIANPTGIYGPLDHPGRLSRMNGMLRDAARGWIPADIAGGFDWVDVRDVATGLLRVAAQGRTGENYLLGGEYLSIHEMFTAAANVAGRRGPLITFPVGVLRAIMPIAAPIGRRLGSDLVSNGSIASLRSAPRVSSEKATEEIGYTARPATTTARELVAWLVNQGLLARRKRA